MYVCMYTRNAYDTSINGGLLHIQGTHNCSSYYISSVLILVYMCSCYCSTCIVVSRTTSTVATVLILLYMCSCYCSTCYVCMRTLDI